MADAAAGENVRSIYMTFPDEATAASIAGTLLEERLIACANIFPGARSLYRWDGKTEDDAEVVAFAKSTDGRLVDLVSRVRELHPYDTPCVVALQVVAGDADYLEWVREETKI